jgi:lipopolysaccharide transport protein LptA
MDNSHPERGRTRLARICQAVIGAVLALLAAGSIANAQDVPKLQPDAPISIDAESSEFDYSTSRLVFHRLRMEQGDLRIEADLAETDKLDFTNGLWVFTGNVKVTTATAVLYCDEARLTFTNHQLTDAVLSGNPARFEQQVPDSDKVNAGEARQIFYQLASQTLRLEKSARFTDGSNEISGDQIVYDLTARRLTADSGESGPVKILIESPNQLKEKIKSP